MTGSNTGLRWATRPAGDDAVPASLFDLAMAWVRDHDLHPVAALQTGRTEYGLLDDNGGVLAEAADDVVTAQSLPPAAGQPARPPAVVAAGGRQRRDHQFVA